jgi:hypothetical protein
MQLTDENIAWATDQLMRLSWMDGFPREEKAHAEIAKAMLGFLCDQPEVWEDQDVPGVLGGKKVKIQDAIPVEETVDWLIARIVANCERFPPPAKMRKLYDSKWRVADRKAMRDVVVE